MSISASSLGSLPSRCLNRIKILSLRFRPGIVVHFGRPDICPAVWAPPCASSLDLLQLFFQKLLVIEASVIAVAGEQFVVRPQFHDAPFMQHGDPVSVA